MKRSIGVLVAAAVVSLFSITGCGPEPRYRTVAVRGDSYLDAAGATLRLEGTVTYRLPPEDGGSAYDLALVIDAISLRTGERYTLYSHVQDPMPGASIPYIAYDANRDLVFQGLLTLDQTVAERTGPSTIAVALLGP